MKVQSFERDLPILIPTIENPKSKIHFMTRFARERNSGESVSPICFAAFKLMTNSNFVACCTGKSAGLAPFKILST